MAHRINFPLLHGIKLLILMELPALKRLTDRTHSKIADRNAGYDGLLLGKANFISELTRIRP